MKDFKKIEVEKDVIAYVGDFELNDSTDVLKQFDPLWALISEQDDRMVTHLFAGIDAARSAFIDIFESDENFKKQPKPNQVLFLKASNVALSKAIQERELAMANGLSFYILWLVAVIQKNYKTAEHIESEFAKLRNAHDI